VFVSPITQSVLLQLPKANPCF